MLPVILAALVLTASPVEMKTITGKVIGVHDGDTITILDGKTQIKVRLNGIDAPEAKQAFGTKSKEALSSKIFGQVVTVQSVGNDRYGRTLGVVKLGGRNINTEMVAEGWAWMYRKYTKSATLDKVEAEARTAKAGLWADAHPVAPWDWRAQQKAKAAKAKGVAKSKPQKKTKKKAA